MRGEGEIILTPDLKRESRLPASCICRYFSGYVYTRYIVCLILTRYVRLTLFLYNPPLWSLLGLFTMFQSFCAKLMSGSLWHLSNRQDVLSSRDLNSL